jgi:hypothetical protein
MYFFLFRNVYTEYTVLKFGVAYYVCHFQPSRTIVLSPDIRTHYNLQKISLISYIYKMPKFKKRTSGNKLLVLLGEDQVTKHQPLQVARL